MLLALFLLLLLVCSCFGLCAEDTDGGRNKFFTCVAVLGKIFEAASASVVRIEDQGAVLEDAVLPILNQGIAEAPEVLC